MDMTNDQENIKRIQQVDSRTRMIKRGREEEWKQIRLEMEAGSSDIIPKNNYFEDKSPLASILHELKKELQSQGDAVAEFETQDWQDEGEWIAQGWCEALAFAIKLIEEHNKS
jgi:hypothetical protein